MVAVQYNICTILNHDTLFSLNTRTRSKHLCPLSPSTLPLHAKTTMRRPRHLLGKTPSLHPLSTIASYAVQMLTPGRILAETSGRTKVRGRLFSAVRSSASVSALTSNGSDPAGGNYYYGACVSCSVCRHLSDKHRRCGGGGRAVPRRQGVGAATDRRCRGISPLAFFEGCCEVYY